ncbi:MAG: hypothetical protein JXN63_07225 [Candidatus Delongbacteria bacterium]|nr:hypothetical protein [Candidatus Delongbacteria bacterium]
MNLFKDIAGQKAVTENLSASVLNNRLHHAYLFSGPAGVGKEAVALELVKILNCQTGKGTSPYCGECRSCKQLTSFSSDDLLYIYPAINKASDSDKVLREKSEMVNQDLKKKSELKGYYKFSFKTGRFITLPQINEIKFFARYNSINRSRKFVIITSAELMNKEAQNSLLKILEEPPGDLFFILISENPSFLFDTIRSRCLSMNFPVLTKQDIRGFLERYHTGIGEEQADKLAEDSFGSIDNLSILMTETGKKLIETHELMYDIFQNSLPPKTVTLIDSLIEEFKLLSDSGIDFVLRKTLLQLLQASFENETRDSNEYRERIVTDFTRFGAMYRRNINPRLLLINLYLNYREEYKKWKNRKIKV